MKDGYSLQKTHYRAKRNKATLVVLRLLKYLISFGMTCTKLQGSRQTCPVDPAYQGGAHSNRATERALGRRDEARCELNLCPSFMACTHATRSCPERKVVSPVKDIKCSTSQRNLFSRQVRPNTKPKESTEKQKGKKAKDEHRPTTT